MTTFQHIVCLTCGHSQEALIHTITCNQCGSAWLDARYDYEKVKGRWSATADQTPSHLSKGEYSLWRYSDLLPISQPDPDISMGEGFTPLRRLHQYERLFNHDMIFVKDERYMPTNSFKDRQAALSVTAMKQAGVEACVLASTGNAGVAYAAYTARAGIKLWLFLTSLVPPEKMREVALYGAQVIKVSGTYDETKAVASRFATSKGIQVDQGAKTIPAKESMKTIAFEIAEQLGLALNQQKGTWIAPDWYVQSVSGGIGPIGVWKGFSELFQMGLIDKMPRLALIQAAGCAPMVRAFEAGKATADPVIPRTLVHVLATGDPGFAYNLLYEAVKSNGGIITSVEDGQTFSAMRQLAEKAGMSVEPATAVAFAGLEKLIHQGVIQKNESVVINVSGHTFPAESHILGDQYDKSVFNIQFNNPQGLPEPNELQGITTSAEEATATKQPIILIIDDNHADLQLARKMLQADNYTILEADSGREGLKAIYQYHPDLIVLDLMLPDVDGFAILETLQNDPALKEIPVVVMSAKTLTADEIQVLQTQIRARIEKTLINRQLFREIIKQKLIN